MAVLASVAHWFSIYYKYSWTKERKRKKMVSHDERRGNQRIRLSQTGIVVRTLLAEHVQGEWCANWIWKTQAIQLHDCFLDDMCQGSHYRWKVAANRNLLQNSWDNVAFSKYPQTHEGHPGSISWLIICVVPNFCFTRWSFWGAPVSDLWAGTSSAKGKRVLNIAQMVGRWILSFPRHGCLVNLHYGQFENMYTLANKLDIPMLDYTRMQMTNSTSNFWKNFFAGPDVILPLD